MVNCGSAIIHAVCVAPIVILIACYVTGLEEQSAVCWDRAYEAEEDTVKEITGNNIRQEEGDLVSFTNDLNPDSIEYSSPIDVGKYFEIPTKNMKTPAIQVKTEMMQCIETTNTKSVNHTDYNHPHGIMLHITWYTYKVGYSTTSISSRTFRGRDLGNLQEPQSQYVHEVHNRDDYIQVCKNVENPPNEEWQGLPTNSFHWASTAKVGDFNIDMFLSKDHLSSKEWVLSPQSIADPQKSDRDFGPESSGSYIDTTKSRDLSIGEVRVSFQSVDMSNLRYTLMGKNDRGTIRNWFAGKTWLCANLEVPAKFRAGEVKATDMIKEEQSANNMMRWIVRFCGFLAFWCAFKCCAEPWEAAAECIPCCGQCIASIISSIASVIGFCLAAACLFSVIAIMWMVMNPLMSIPMLLIACFIWGWMIFYCVKKANSMGPDAVQNVMNKKMEEFTKAAAGREKVALQEPLKFSAVSVV